MKKKIIFIVIFFFLVCGVVVSYYLFNTEKEENKKVEEMPKEEVKIEEPEPVIRRMSIVMVGDALIHGAVYLMLKKVMEVMISVPCLK